MVYECHICKGLCDPGELENGACFECRLESAKRMEKRNFEIRRSINSILKERIRQQEDGQMVMRV